MRVSNTMSALDCYVRVILSWSTSVKSSIKQSAGDAFCTKRRLQCLS